MCYWTLDGGTLKGWSSEGWSWELGTGERLYGATYLYTRRPYMSAQLLREARSWHFNLFGPIARHLISHYAQRHLRVF